MWFHLMQKNFSENFSSVEVDDYTHEYLIRIPEWIINEMNWYDGTELNIKLDGEEIIKCMAKQCLYSLRSGSRMTLYSTYSV